MNNPFRSRRKQRSLREPKSICVWGPLGASGKSVLAANLACEFALAGRRVLLVDLDTYAPTLKDLFGVVDSPPGVAAAARLFTQGRLDREQFERLAVHFEIGAGSLSLLAGLGSASRWAELSKEKVEGLIESAKRNFEVVVIDVASPLESSIRQVGGVVERNAATRTTLQVADQTVVVISADHIGARRLLDSHEQLKELTPRQILVANRLRRSVLGSRAKHQLQDALAELLGVQIDAFIPDDPESSDRALLEMIPIALMKRSSPARQAISNFARANFIGEQSNKKPVITKLG
jgi:MinD-like ATPase involved in chromosome partitioning or flagellar assembly